MSQDELWVAPRNVARELGFLAVLTVVIPVVLVLAFVRLDLGWGPILDFYIPSVVVTVCVGGAIRGIYVAVIPRLPLGSLGWAGRPVVHAVVTLVGAIGGSEVAKLVLGLGYGVPPSAFVAVTRIAVVVSAVVVTGIALWDGLLGYVREVELREERAQSALVRAELRALQARTDPHFLFNSLNVVAGLVHEDPDGAERVLERLASVFRYALASSRRTEVPLGEELEAVRDYVGVERVRFDDRIRFELEVEPGLEAVRVPPFVLQPLVENAVLHGVSAKSDGGTVWIRARREDGELVLEVQDDGAGSGSVHEGTGTALEDLRERLRLVHGDDAAVRTEALDPGFKVVVRLPVEGA